MEIRGTVREEGMQILLEREEKQHERAQSTEKESERSLKEKSGLNEKEGDSRREKQKENVREI